jgi:hypothetical protein
VHADVTVVCAPASSLYVGAVSAVTSADLVWPSEAAWQEE